MPHWRKKALDNSPFREYDNTILKRWWTEKVIVVLSAESCRPVQGSVRKRWNWSGSCPLKAVLPVGWNGFPPLQGRRVVGCVLSGRICGNESGTAEWMLRLLMFGLRDGAFFILLYVFRPWALRIMKVRTRKWAERLRFLTRPCGMVSSLPDLSLIHIFYDNWAA